MDIAVLDIQTKFTLPDVLEAQIDEDIAQAESEIDAGEGLMEAHEAFRLLRDKHGDPEFYDQLIDSRDTSRTAL